MKACSISGCKRAWACRQFCNMHYERWRKYGDPLYMFRARAETPETRFWSKVRKSDGCWLWTGAPNKNGYGQLRMNGHNVPAHVFSFYLANGYWPKPMCLHSCDNPPCVNPGHLRSGTGKDNSNDRVERGRNNVPFGEKSASAKLKESDVLRIRHLINEGRLSLRAIARQFGVVHENVRAIRDGRSWTHLA